MTQKRLVIGSLLLAFCGSLVAAPTTYAVELRIQPAVVRDTIAPNERKKGFVDIINPTGATITVSLSVQAARQVDGQGNLAFFDDNQLKEGLRLDYDEVELRGHEALRLYYLVDAAKLPPGDVLAAVFATVKPQAEGPAVQALRVGTVVALSNSSTKREVRLMDVRMPLLQFGDALTADFSIKNTASPVNVLFPAITVETAPYGNQEVSGPLVTAGNSRTISYRKAGNYIGPVYVKIHSHGAVQGQWVFAVTGFWQWLAPLVTIAICAFVIHRRLRSKKVAKH